MLSAEGELSSPDVAADERFSDLRQLTPALSFDPLAAELGVKHRADHSRGRDEHVLQAMRLDAREAMSSALREGHAPRLR